MREDEFHGFISYFPAAIVPPLQQRFQQRQRQPRPQRPYMPPTPAQKTLRRAWCGAAVLTACLWLSPVVWREFAGPLLRALHDPPLEVWLPFALWAFAMLAGLAGLLVGLQEAGATLPRSWMGAFWSLSLLLAIGALFVWQVYPDDDLAGYAVRGVYVTAAVVAAVHLWIASGLAAASAERVIRRQLKQRNAVLHPAKPRRRRRFFFF